MRRRLGAVCDAPGTAGQFHPLPTSSTAASVFLRSLATPTSRWLVSACVAHTGNARTADNAPRVSVASAVSSGPAAPHCTNDNAINNVVVAAPAMRGNFALVEADSSGSGSQSIARAGPKSSSSEDSLLLEHLHTAPAGMADRIAAASRRHANWQLQQQQQPQQHQHLQEQQPDHQRHHFEQHRQQQQQLCPPTSLQRLPHDPESCRLWEARLLSRACQSLAFHISSHFHVPAGPSDPLASVLTSGTRTSPTFNSSSSSSGAAILPPQLALPAYGASALQGSGAAAALQGQLEQHPPHGDLYGMYDNLPAVYALKAVAGLLIDPTLWRDLAPTESLSRQLFTAPQFGGGSTSLHGQAVAPSGPGAAAAAAEMTSQSPHSEAPSAMNALAHVVAGALLQLAHACGHPGCYSLTGPPLPSPPPPSNGAGKASAAVSVLATPPSAAAAGPPPPPLTGVPFTGRQLTRLYDMAAAVDAVDVGALAGLPASAAAALLVLLAAAQPPSHPAVQAVSSRGGAVTPTIPAALLARYLRVGSRAHNPLDTVRVMWAFLRLQLPGAGSMLLPLELDGDGSSSSSSEDDDAVAAVPLPDPMAQLAAILSRQLQNRDRALAALRAARPGELYGTWQLAVQTQVLLHDRALAEERSAAALSQLDSALALLEATLAGSGSGFLGNDAESGSGSQHAFGLLQGGANTKAHKKRGKRGSKGSAGSGQRIAAAAAGGGGDGDSAARGAASVPTLEALRTFLDFTYQVSVARQEAAGAAAAAAGDDGAAVATAGASDPVPAWDLVPSSAAEWREVLDDTEQRTALLLSTWPELGRLVEPQPQSVVGAEVNGAGSGGPSWDAPSATPSAAGSPAPAVSAASNAAQQQQRRRLRIHLQSYSVLHFRTLELLYRAVKAQAPDAQLLAPLSPPETNAADAGTAAVTTAGAVPTLIPPAGSSSGGGGALGSPAVSQRILSAVALPYSAAVDMVFTDTRGRRVGLCLAHLGASRRAPGELAVLQHALAGWPEAAAAAAQQGFRAARSAARAAAAAAAACAQERAARAAAAAAGVFAVVGAAAAAAAAAAVAASQSFDEGGPLAEAATRAAAAAGPHGGGGSSALEGGLLVQCASAAGAPSHDGAVSSMSGGKVATSSNRNQNQHESPYDGTMDGDGGGEIWTQEQTALLEAAAAALEADAAAVAAAPAIAAAAAAQAAAAAALAPVVGGGGGAAAATAFASCDSTRPPPALDDLVVLELDHDWFHLRESYYDHVRERKKWTPEVRQAIGASMSYMELPWEAQLDMVWHTLAAAGVELPIRMFA